MICTFWLPSSTFGLIYIYGRASRAPEGAAEYWCYKKIFQTLRTIYFYEQSLSFWIFQAVLKLSKSPTRGPQKWLRSELRKKNEVEVEIEVKVEKWSRSWSRSGKPKSKSKSKSAKKRSRDRDRDRSWKPKSKSKSPKKRSRNRNRSWKAKSRWKNEVEVESWFQQKTLWANFLLKWRLFFVRRNIQEKKELF